MSDTQRLSEVFVQLADTLVTDFDVVEFMTLLASVSVELLTATEAGVALVDESGQLRSVASSSEAARLLELFELQNDQGPCLDSVRTGVAITNHLLDPNTSPWPDFAREALASGFTMVHALPMRLRGQIIGAVNVFAVESTPLTAPELAVGQALADVATIALLQERGIRQAQVLNQQLQAALTSRVVIEQAKGMLAERLGVSMDEAFTRLRNHARSSSTRLSAVAEGVLDRSIDTELLARPTA